MSKSVAERSAASQAMLTAARKHRALMGGGDAMRDAAEAFLPRFPAESQEAYDARLKGSWLFNGYRKCVRDMAGRVFDKPVEVADGPQQLIDWCENADMQGQDLSTFAREVFTDAFAAGVSFIMVDAPRRDAETTRADAQPCAGSNSSPRAGARNIGPPTSLAWGT